MTFLDRSSARDALCAIVDAALAGESLTIVWDGDGEAPPSDTALSWARVSIRHVDSKQSTLGPVGARKYLTSGLMYVQIFTPLGDGLSEDDRLAMILLSALRADDTAGLTLRNIRPVETGPDGGWHQTNVIAEFEYEEQG